LDAVVAARLSAGYGSVASPASGARWPVTAARNAARRGDKRLVVQKPDRRSITCQCITCDNMHRVDDHPLPALLKQALDDNQRHCFRTTIRYINRRCAALEMAS
jgi:hypothetical protein